MRRKLNDKHTLQRNTVLEAAAKMFSEKGFGGTSLGDVAKDLDISRPALYYYFSSKQEILSSLVDEISVKTKKTIGETISSEMDVINKIYRMTYDHCLFVMRHKMSYMVVVKTEEELVAETRKMNLEAKKAVLEGFKNVIQEGMDAGQFRRMDAAVAALAIIGMCNWCAWWFKDGGRLSDEQVAEQITQMALASLFLPQRTEDARHDIAAVVRNLEAAIEGLNALEKKY